MSLFWIRAGAGAVLLFSVFGLGWHAKSVVVKAEQARELKQANADLVRRVERDAGAVRRYEETKAALDAKARVITKEVTRVIREPFYAGPGVPLCLDDRGMQQLRAAVVGPDPGESDPDGAVPEALDAR